MSRLERSNWTRKVSQKKMKKKMSMPKSGAPGSMPMLAAHLFLIVLGALQPLQGGADPILYLRGLCHDKSQDLPPLSLSLQGLSEGFRILREGHGREIEVVREMILCMNKVCSPLEVSTFSIHDCNSLADFMTKDFEDSPLELEKLNPLVVASVYNDLATGVPSLGIDFKESFLRLALKYRKGERVIVKNLGYLLEQTGRHGEAEAMYRDALSTRPADPGLNLIVASMCPPHHMSVEATSRTYERIVSRFHQLLSTVSHNSMKMDPATEIGQMPIGWPYLGYALRPLNELLGRTYSLFFPMLTEGVIDVGPEGYRRGGGAVRLGIVAESIGNTSPGQLIDAVLERLGKGNNIEIIFFKPPGLDTEFSRMMDSVASATYTLKMYSTATSQEMIKSAECDVLLYLALGMSPSTYYLR